MQLHPSNVAKLGLATLEGGSCTVPETVVTVLCTPDDGCGTGHIFCASTSLQRGQASLATLEGGSCTVPEAVVTVLCTPEDGCV